MTEDEKRAFDALMQLVEFRTKRIADRRSHEWKITYGLWALLATGIGVLYEHPARDSLVSWIWAALLAAVLLHLAWVTRHWCRSREDAQFALYYGDTAERLLHGAKVQFHGHPPKTLTERDKPRHGWRALRRACCDWVLVCGPIIGTTALLAVALGVAATPH